MIQDFRKKEEEIGSAEKKTRNREKERNLREAKKKWSKRREKFRKIERNLILDMDATKMNYFAAQAHLETSSDTTCNQVLNHRKE